MWYHAKQLARQAEFVKICEERSLNSHSEEAEELWQELLRQAPRLVSTRDIRDIPDWIATTNLLAFIAGLALLIWALVLVFQQ